MPEWKEEGKCTEYDVLIPASEKASISLIIDVDDARFVSHVNMADIIADYCRETNLQVTSTLGEYVKWVLLSLAERYKKVVIGLNRLLSAPVEKLQIIGGGAQNKYLNRLTSEATGLVVETGPVEATAIGNIKAQMNLVKKYWFIYGKHRIYSKKYSTEVKIYCQTLDLRDSTELISEYKLLHSRERIWPKILEGIKSVGILEMGIYILGIRLFVIVETLVDFNRESAMSKLSTLPRQQEWEDYMSIFQSCEPGESSSDKWKQMDRIFLFY